jgi:hypothetical protein
VTKEEFLLGKDMGTVETSVPYMLINMYIKFRIWKYKIAGVLPRQQNIANDVVEWTNKLTTYHKWRLMLPLVQRHINI